jgi:hypothetical protein
MNDVVTFINHLANQSREDGAVTVEDMTYLTEEFPAGFWRKLAKEVNYISTQDEIVKLQKSQDVVDRYIKESLLDIQLLEGIAKAMFDRNELYSVETYNWKGYTARLWNNQFPDVTDYWVMLAQTALKDFYEKTNLY